MGSFHTKSQTVTARYYSGVILKILKEKQKVVSQATPEKSPSFA